MSRHHTLPPIIYTPPPPKPARRRRIGYAGGAGAASDARNTADVEDGVPVRSAPPLPPHARPVEAAERRVPSPNGKLSDETLRAMLDVQEREAK